MDVAQANGIATQPYQPSPVEKQSPPEAVVRQVRQALAAARRPAICAGRGVLVHRAEAELAALAEAHSAPVLCSNYGSGAIADLHHHERQSPGVSVGQKHDPFILFRQEGHIGPEVGNVAAM